MSDPMTCREAALKLMDATPNDVDPLTWLERKTTWQLLGLFGDLPVPEGVLSMYPSVFE